MTVYGAMEMLHYQLQSLPPLWKTWYAYLFYLAFTISMIMLFIRYKTLGSTTENGSQLKQMEKQNIEISHNMGVQNVHQFLT